MMDILQASMKDSPHAAGRLHRRARTSLSLGMHMHTATATGVGWMMGGGKADVSTLIRGSIDSG